MKKNSHQADPVSSEAGSGKKASEEERRSREIVRRLAESSPFCQKDCEQIFYRNVEEYPLELLKIVKLGWKIKDLPSEEQELALLCFSLLSSESRFPLSISLNEVETGRGERLKSLWIETVILCSPESADNLERSRRNIEVSIFSICEYQLVPLFQSFLEAHLSWKIMLRPDFSEQRLMQLFKQEVLQRVAQIMEERASLASN